VLRTKLDLLKEKARRRGEHDQADTAVRFDLQFIVTGSDRKFVYWLERRNVECFCGFHYRGCRPADNESCLMGADSVLKSATPFERVNFAFIRDILGLTTGH